MSPSAGWVHGGRAVGISRCRKEEHVCLGEFDLPTAEHKRLSISSNLDNALFTQSPRNSADFFFFPL